MWWTFNGSWSRQKRRLFGGKVFLLVENSSRLRREREVERERTFYTHRCYFHSFNSIACTWSKRPEQQKPTHYSLVLEISANEYHRTEWNFLVWFFVNIDDGRSSRTLAMKFLWLSMVFSANYVAKSLSFEWRRLCNFWETLQLQSCLSCGVFSTF